MTGINISVSSPPNVSFFNEHYHCDYIELLALVHNCDIVSLSDVHNRYTNSNEGSDDSEAEAERQGDADYAPVTDRWETRVHDWFLMLESRSLSYGDAYPFTVEDRNMLSLKRDLTQINHIYIFLLLNSLLGYFDRSDRSRLTADFEEISFCALEKYLPDYAIIHKFGKSNIANKRYRGNIVNKIDLLAVDLKRKTKYKPYFFADQDNGDLGIDLVAWMPITEDENYCYIQIMFVQCGAGKDWLKKQDEAIRSVRNCLCEIDEPTNMMFIPYDARNADRTFNEEAKIESSLLLFDRRRIISLLSKTSEVVCKLESHEDIVIGLVKFEEKLV